MRKMEPIFKWKFETRYSGFDDLLFKTSANGVYVRKTEEKTQEEIEIIPDVYLDDPVGQVFFDDDEEAVRYLKKYLAVKYFSDSEYCTAPSYERVFPTMCVGDSMWLVYHDGEIALLELTLVSMLMV